jgi:hypothetical protein
MEVTKGTFPFPRISIPLQLIILPLVSHSEIRKPKSPNLSQNLNPFSSINITLCL